MSSSSREIHITQESLEDLTDKVLAIAKQYEDKSFFSAKKHKEGVGNLGVLAMTCSEQLQKNNNMTDEKISYLYLALVSALETQFNAAVKNWGASAGSSHIVKGMSTELQYGNYIWLCLNKEIDKHTSTRNVGLALRSAYMTLQEQAKINLMLPILTKTDKEYQQSFTQKK
jgi:hypothetical protein